MNTEKIDGSEFVLTIRLGNEAMQTPAEIAESLRKVAKRLDDDGIHAMHSIMDANSARVGGWLIE